MTPTLPQRPAAPDTGSNPGERDDAPPMFHVVLLDDDEHSYEYVIEMLCALFMLSPETAYKNACEVDATGQTVVITCEKALAEFGRDQIHAYGADPRMDVSKGSMSARVEPAT
ncbi:MAG: ATP-dependent Clp protease adaptor ClpS [Acidobacteriota bacterium]